MSLKAQHTNLHRITSYLRTGAPAAQAPCHVLTALLCSRQPAQYDQHTNCSPERHATGKAVQPQACATIQQTADTLQWTCTSSKAQDMSGAHSKHWITTTAAGDVAQGVLHLASLICSKWSTIWVQKSTHRCDSRRQQLSGLLLLAAAAAATASAVNSSWLAAVVCEWMVIHGPTRCMVPHIANTHQNMPDTTKRTPDVISHLDTFLKVKGCTGQDTGINDRALVRSLLSTCGCCTFELLLCCAAVNF